MARNPVGALSPGDMHNLVETLAQRIERPPDRPVQIAGALAAARHEKMARRHRRYAWLEALPQGDSGQHDPPGPDPLVGAGECRADRGRAAGEYAGGEAGTNVLLVQHVRDSTHAGRGDRRRHHVAAHAENDVRPEVIDDAEPCQKGRRDDDGEREILPHGVPVEPPHVDGRKLEAGGRHQPLLGPTRAPDQQESTVRFLSAKGSRSREPFALRNRTVLSCWSGARVGPRSGWCLPPASSLRPSTCGGSTGTPCGRISRSPSSSRRPFWQGSASSITSGRTSFSAWAAT